MTTLVAARYDGLECPRTESSLHSWLVYSCPTQFVHGLTKKELPVISSPSGCFKAPVASLLRLAPIPRYISASAAVLRTSQAPAWPVRRCFGLPSASGPRPGGSRASNGFSKAGLKGRPVCAPKTSLDVHLPTGMELF